MCNLVVPDANQRERALSALVLLEVGPDRSERAHPVARAVIHSVWGVDS